MVVVRSSSGGDGCKVWYSDCCRTAILKCILGWDGSGVSSGLGVVVVVVVVGYL